MNQSRPPLGLLSDPKSWPDAPLAWDSPAGLLSMTPSPEPPRNGLLDTLSYYAGPHVTQSVSGIANLARALAEPALSLLPGSGEAMSARDSMGAARNALSAALMGDYGQAGVSGANSLLSAAGAIPLYGAVTRGTKPLVNALLSTPEASKSANAIADAAAAPQVDRLANVAGRFSPEDQEAMIAAFNKRARGDNKWTERDFRKTFKGILEAPTGRNRVAASQAAALAEWGQRNGFEVLYEPRYGKGSHYVSLYHDNYPYGGIEVRFSDHANLSSLRDGMKPAFNIAPDTGQTMADALEHLSDLLAGSPR